MAKGRGGFIGQDGLNAPNSPTSVSASAGDQQADVSFIAPSDVGGSAITGYRAQSNTGVGASGSSSPITVTGLSNGTSYTFNVWAINAFGYSAPSDASGSVTPAQPTLAMIFQGGGNTNVAKFNMDSAGNATDFGDTPTSVQFPCALSNATRLIQAGGTSDTVSQISYWTVTSGGTGQDFGDTAHAGYGKAAVNTNTRGVFMGGYVGGSGPGVINSMGYITIASTGDGTDFGDLTVGKYRGAGSINSTTRGVHSAGYLQGFSMTNVVDYITIASTGNATDFGDTISAIRQHGGCSNSTRGLQGGGVIGASATNEISYLTIASTGNMTDFGDLSSTSSNQGAAADSTNAFFYSGDFASGNGIQYVTIASTGNSSTWADLYSSQQNAQYGTSAGHGGIS